MSAQNKPSIPDHTAVRVALWRALHIQIDPAPHILTDEVGEKLVGENGWRARQDMNPEFSKPMRASIVGRARFIEDLVEAESQRGVTQYVILGAGLDTFAQRHSRRDIEVFEIDQTETQAWKKQRLSELGYAQATWPHFVGVNFESGESWYEKLKASGFNPELPTVIVSTGVSMYLSREANLATLKQVATLASGSTFAMTFMLKLELLEPKERGIMEFVMKRAAESGTPFVSLFKPEEIQSLAAEAGFKSSRYVSARELFNTYFASRTDGLRAGDAEAFLVAKT